MVTTRRPKEPDKRMGVYTRLEDVPDRYRLYHHEAAYAERDVWEEYLTEYFLDTFGTDYTEQYARRAGRDWKEHMTERGRHHALATPEDVDTWCTALVDRMKPRSAYQNYWTKLERFYSWLQTHTDHPHVYHPVLMAAAEYPAAGQIWDIKIGTWRDDQ
ncbi:MAG: hypothetical protein ABEH64_03145 [Salinirussus sp.]